MALPMLMAALALAGEPSWEDLLKDLDDDEAEVVAFEGVPVCLSDGQMLFGTRLVQDDDRLKLELAGEYVDIPTTSWAETCRDGLARRRGDASRFRLVLLAGGQRLEGIPIPSYDMYMWEIQLRDLRPVFVPANLIVALDEPTAPPFEPYRLDKEPRRGKGWIATVVIVSVLGATAILAVSAVFLIALANAGPLLGG